MEPGKALKGSTIKLHLSMGFRLSLSLSLSLSYTHTHSLNLILKHAHRLFLLLALSRSDTRPNTHTRVFVLESVCRVAIRSNSQTSNNHEPTNKVLSYSTHTHPHTHALSSQTHTPMCKRIHTLVSDNINNNSESSQTHPYLTINPDTDRGLRVTRSHLLISLSHPSLTLSHYLYLSQNSHDLLFCSLLPHIRLIQLLVFTSQ